MTRLLILASLVAFLECRSHFAVGARGLAAGSLQVGVVRQGVVIALEIAGPFSLVALNRAFISSTEILPSRLSFWAWTCSRPMLQRPSCLA